MSWNVASLTKPLTDPGPLGHQCRIDPETDSAGTPSCERFKDGGVDHLHADEMKGLLGCARAA